jgi:hypothetical protein
MPAANPLDILGGHGRTPACKVRYWAASIALVGHDALPHEEKLHEEQEKLEAKKRPSRRGSLASQEGDTAVYRPVKAC